MLINLLKNNERKSRLMFVLSAFIASLVFDFLVWDYEVGAGFVIFIIFSIILFTAGLFFTGKIKSIKSAVILIPVAILLIDILLYSNDLVVGIAPLVVCILSLLYFILITLNLNGKKLFFRAIPWFSEAENIFIFPLSKLKQINQDLFSSSGSFLSSNVRKLILAFLISMPIVLVFISLFSAADIIFSDAINKLLGLNIDLSFVPHIIRTFLMTLFLATGFYVLLDDKHKLEDYSKTAFKIDSIIINTVLILVNAVFLLFVAIQIRYLFGSASYVFASGITYAEYARNGFFELVKVLILAGLLLTAMLRSGSYHGISNVTKSLKLFLVGQVLIIAVSALRRMYLYQDIYGFTALRLYVEWFIYFAIVVLMLIGAFAVIKAPFKKYWYSMICLGIVSLTVVCSLNVDKIIAVKNISRSLKENKPLDAEYLLSLSADALPELEKNINKKIELKGELNNWPEVEKAINEKKVNLMNAYNNWREYNVGVSRIK